MQSFMLPEKTYAIDPIAVATAGIANKNSVFKQTRDSLSSIIEIAPTRENIPDNKFRTRISILSFLFETFRPKIKDGATLYSECRVRSNRTTTLKNIMTGMA